MDTTILLPGLRERAAAMVTVPDSERAAVRAAWKQALKAADGNFATQDETHAAAIATLVQDHPTWNAQAVTVRIMSDRSTEKWAAV